MLWTSVGAAALAVGCASPLETTTQEALRRELVQSHRKYLEAVAAGPVIELSRAPSAVEQSLREEGLVEQLDAVSGPGAYQEEPLDLGPNLLGEANTSVVTVSLQQVLQMAAKNNLDIQLARIRPAITEAQIVQAEAVFDAIYFANYEYANLDQPGVPGLFAGFGGDTRERAFLFTTGIRKTLSTGGQISVETQTGRTFREPSTTTINTFDTANLSVNIVQPLLRNFGSDVTLAEVYLTRNARAADVQALRQTMLDIIAQTEQAYWDLYLARQQLLIQLRLLQRTEEDLQVLIRRRELDVPVVAITEARAAVEQRRFDVIQARQRVRLTSDRLKQLINDPDLPVSGEALLLPADAPADMPIEFSLVDAVTTALQERPEMQRALLAISDASIRLRVADNQRLPELNLAATVRFSGLGDSTDDAYGEMFEGDFIDFLLSAQFQVPIGNRGPEAQYRRFQLERQATVINYQRIGQAVVLEVKDALRQLTAAYELIGAARAARRAAADNLRAIYAQEEAGVALTPEFIDLKLRRQEALARFEIEEIQALTNYNTAVAQFYRSIGTLLKRNGIIFSEAPVVDTPADLPKVQ